VEGRGREGGGKGREREGEEDSEKRFASRLASLDPITRSRLNMKEKRREEGGKKQKRNRRKRKERLTRGRANDPSSDLTLSLQLRSPG